MPHFLQFLHVLTSRKALVGIIILLGIVLRYLYVDATPHWVREHDVNAHIEYILYVAEHWNIPNSSEGWEYHQAPLYYFIAAAWYALGSVMERANDLLLRDIQWGSFLFTVGSLLLCIPIGRLLFDITEKDGRRGEILFFFLTATFPGLILFSSALSNDPPFTLTSFFFFWMLLKYWQDATMRSWLLVLLTILLAWFTKATALLYGPVTFGVLLLQRQSSWPIKRKLLIGIISGIALMILAGWLPVMRFVTEDNGRMIPFGGHFELSDNVMLPTTPKEFIVFNPFAFVPMPYNSAQDDSARRINYWEYFYRSSFFGEYQFGDALQPVAIALLVTGLILLALAIYGIIQSLYYRAWQDAPIWITMLMMLLGSIMYRIQTPCSCNQDFRFVPLLALPVIYAIAYGYTRLPRPLMIPLLLVILLFGALSTWFFAGVHILAV